MKCDMKRRGERKIAATRLHPQKNTRRTLRAYFAGIYTFLTYFCGGVLPHS